MPGWLWVLFWWLAFAGTHAALSSIPVRRPLIARLGARGFQGLYSLVAFATFVPLVMAYWRNQHDGPLLWSLAGVPAISWIAIGLGVVGFALLVSALLQPSATSLSAGAATARGVVRITRHPLFTGIGLWGLGHALVNGFLSDVVFFGGFLVYSLVGAAHQDARKRVTEADRLGAFYAETSLLPFGAILAGRNRLVVSEVPWVGVGIGIGAAIILYVLHPRLF